jgi:hypothetical protein
MREVRRSAFDELACVCVLALRNTPQPLQPPHQQAPQRTTTAENAQTLHIAAMAACAGNSETPFACSKHQRFT